MLGVPVLVGQHGTGPWQVSVFTPGDDATRDLDPAWRSDPQEIPIDLTTHGGRDTADAEIAALIRARPPGRGRGVAHRRACGSTPGRSRPPASAVPADGDRARWLGRGATPTSRPSPVAVASRHRRRARPVELRRQSRPTTGGTRSPPSRWRTYTDSVPSRSRRRASMRCSRRARRTPPPGPARMLGDGTAYLTITGLREVSTAPCSGTRRSTGRRSRPSRTSRRTSAGGGSTSASGRRSSAHLDAHGLALDDPGRRRRARRADPGWSPSTPSTQAADRTRGPPTSSSRSALASNLERYDSVTQEIRRGADVTLRENCRGSWGFNATGTSARRSSPTPTPASR